MRRNLAVLFALSLLALAGFTAAMPGSVGALVDTVATNDGVCDNLDTGHLSAGNATSTTITAPVGMVIVKVCVKAGSDNQGLGPEYTTFDPGVSSVTISHSSGKEISHYSVDYEPAPDDTETETTTPETGTIIITKQTDPDGDPTSFSFSATYGTFSLSDGQSNNSGPLAPGTYAVFEFVPAGWTLTGTTCSDGEIRTRISLEAGQTVTCTVTNTKNQDTTTTTTTETEPPGRCPPGQGPFAGKDGEPGNQECCPDANNDQKCDSAPPPPTTTVTPPPTTTTPVTPPVVQPPATTTPETVSPTPDKAPAAKSKKQPKKQPKLKPPPPGAPPGAPPICPVGKQTSSKCGVQGSG